MLSGAQTTNFLVQQPDNRIYRQFGVKVYIFGYLHSHAKRTKVAKSKNVADIEGEKVVESVKAANRSRFAKSMKVPNSAKVSKVAKSPKVASSGSRSKLLLL